MMGEGRSASHFCSLSVLAHQPVEIKGGKLPIGLKLTKRPNMEKRNLQRHWGLHAWD